MNRAALWLLGRALRFFPAEFVAAYGAEIRETLESELNRRALAGGGWAGTGYALRSSWDLAVQGTRERLRKGPLPGYGTPRYTDRGRWGMWDGIGSDLRLGWRSITRAPGLAAAATLVLALGIGANATVFTALKTAVLAPLPFEEPERLIMADVTAEHEVRGETRILPWSYPKFQVFQNIDDRLIDPAAGYATRNATLSDPGEPVQIDLEVVSPGYFGVLAMRPVLGRVFGPDEADVSSVPMVVVLSHELWQTRFAGDSRVLGQTVTLNGRQLEVIGVAPSGFDGLGGGAKVWLPMLASEGLFNRRMLRQAQAHWFHVVGRLRPGARFEDALAQMSVIGAAIDEAHPARDPGQSYSGSARLLEDVRVNERARASVWLLAAAALLVLVVACANLSGLMLARARRRARDGALRLAVGASRWRLIRSSLAESLLLAGLGGALGVAIAVWGTDAMAGLWPREFLSSADHEMRIMNVEGLAVDGAVLTFSVLATLLATVMFGLGPALRSSNVDLGTALKDGAGATRRGRTFLGLDGRSALVGIQVALALVLIVGTGLVGSSMARLLATDQGFAERNVLIYRYSIPRTSARSSQPIPFHDEFRERVLRIPRVEEVSSGCAPLRGHCWGITRVDQIEGQEPIGSGEGPMIGVTTVSDSYFETLGIPLLEGRVLDQRDGTDALPTMVVNRRAAQALFPDESAVGKRIEIGIGGEGKESMVEIVGVVENVLYDAADQQQFLESYYSEREFPDAGVTMLVRTSGDPMDVLPQIRAELALMDPDLALSGISTINQVVSRSVGDRRIIFALLAAFAALAAVLSATGTWGIVSYSVADRRRELGLRLALGASESRVLKLVLGDSARTAVLGLVAGGLGAFLASRVLGAFLYETSRQDPVVFGGGAFVLLAIVLLASYLPARRATRVDPVEALRAE